MTNSNAWTQANIFFRRTPDKDGQNLGDGRPPQHQTNAEIQVDNGWLRIKQNGREEIITVPATSVDYIVTQG